MIRVVLPAHLCALARCEKQIELDAEPTQRAVLDALEVPYCVASSGSHAKMATTLGATGLLARFSGRIFSAVDVERGKPAPDIKGFKLKRAK